MKKAAKLSGTVKIYSSEDDRHQIAPGELGKMATTRPAEEPIHRLT